MRNFLTTTDLNTHQLDTLLESAARVKAGADPRRLPGRTMGMVFFNPSLRTRTSFEVAMHHLGGHAVNLAVGQGMWDLETADGVVMDGATAEHVKEAAQ